MASNSLTQAYNTPILSLPGRLALHAQFSYETASLTNLAKICNATECFVCSKAFPDAPPSLPERIPSLTQEQQKWVIFNAHHASLPESLSTLLELAWEQSRLQHWIPEESLPCGIQDCTRRIHQYQHNEGDRTQYYCSDTHARAGWTSWVAARRTAHLAQEHMCTLPNCAATTNLKRCLGCRVVRYCSTEHQTADWQNHKPWCKLFSSN